jgi:hypothetical protein
LPRGVGCVCVGGGGKGVRVVGERRGGKWGGWVGGCVVGGWVIGWVGGWVGEDGV